MRTLFLAFGRVFGLVQVYYALAYLTSILPIIGMMRHVSSGATEQVAVRTLSGTNITLTMGSMIATLVLTFGVAWLLLSRTEWLAEKLKISEDSAQPPLSADAILHVGAKLLGLFIIIQAAPTLIGQLGRTISVFQQQGRLYGSMDFGVSGRAMFDVIWSSLVAPALKLALGLLLTLRTDVVLNWTNRKPPTEQPSPQP